MHQMAKTSFGMTTTDINSVLVAFASWEDRFVQGVRRDLNEIACAQVLVFYFSSYCDQTEHARAEIRRECEERKLSYEEVKLDSDLPHDNLHHLDAAILDLDASLPVVVDISTMPREVIWHVFWLCEYRAGPLHYRYYSPLHYSSDWLSRDPGRPRLVHKLSGIALPQLKTVLLLAAGYDIQRVSQLIRFFEPSKLLLALQTDSPFPDNKPIMERYAKELGGGGRCETFPIDAFQKDHGYDAFEEQLQDIVGEYNVILGSLGPKLSAVSLYRIRQRWPQVALVYAPANEFNMDYSRGIRTLFEGTVKPE